MKTKINYEKLAEVYEGMIDKKNKEIAVWKSILEIEGSTQDILREIIAKLKGDVEHERHERFKFNFLLIAVLIALILIILI